jgi:hypothetical protein
MDYLHACTIDLVVRKRTSDRASIQQVRAKQKASVSICKNTTYQSITIVHSIA